MQTAYYYSSDLALSPRERERERERETRARTHTHTHTHTHTLVEQYGERDLKKEENKLGTLTMGQ